MNRPSSFLKAFLRPLPLALAGAFLLILGAKWTLIEHYGSSVPFVDQWDAEGMKTLVPWYEGTFRPALLWENHNEHRIVLTKILVLCLSTANDQWDARLMMGVNALIHAAMLVTLLTLLGRRLSHWAALSCLSFCGLLYCLPFSWENTLESFQSQFYLLSWLAIGSLALLLTKPTFSRSWVLGLLLSLFSLGAMGSGFLAPASAACLLAIKLFFSRERAGKDFLAILLLSVICVLGVLSLTHIPAHDAGRPASVGAFLKVFLECLAWPAQRISLWAGLLLQLPLLLVAGLWIRGKSSDANLGLYLGLGLWTWLQMAAMCAGRGHFSIAETPRYTDILAINVLANVFSLGLLSDRLQRTRFLVVFTSQAALLSLGIGTYLAGTSAGIPDFVPLQRMAARHHLSRYLLTGDSNTLTQVSAIQLPYPKPDSLIRYLDHESLRLCLPAAVRVPLRVVPTKQSLGFVAAPPPPESELAKEFPAWTNTSPVAHFVSEALPQSAYPFLRLRLYASSQLDAKGLFLVTQDGIKVPLDTHAFVPNQWFDGLFKIPHGHGELHLEAQVRSPGAQLFFSAPVELGSLSYAMDRAYRLSPYLLSTGLGLLLLSALRCALLAKSPTKCITVT